MEGRDEKMRFAKGNTCSQSRSLAEWLDLFQKMKDYLRASDLLSLNELLDKFDVPYSTFKDNCLKYKELNSFRDDLRSILIARINRGAIKNEFNPTSSIWRMKQLGEVDSRDINNNHSGQISGDHTHRVIFEDYKEKEEE